MATGLLHAHKFFVLLFLIHYVLKLLFLQLKKDDLLEKYSKATRIPEMILSFGFLATGIAMLVMSKSLGTLMIVKILFVLAAIPLAVIGFKKKKGFLALASVVLIVGAYGLAEMNRSQKAGGAVDTTSLNGDKMAIGKEVYHHSCENCHGADGKLNSMGAKDLSLTVKTPDEQKAIIRHGKNYMPAHKDLTDEQVDAVIQYVASFKQTAQ
ncbi:MAG: cytochrome c [Chitinophagales bacterium]